MSDPTLDSDRAAIALLHALGDRGYRFVTPTRDTFRATRLRRFVRRKATLRDVFGWSRTFRTEGLDPELFTLMRAAGLVEDVVPGYHRSRIACASLGDTLLFHSPLARRSEDVTFFGPDSYRFAIFLRRQIGHLAVGARIVDIGAGTGAGALAIAALRPDLHLVLADINPAALALARINLAAAGIDAEFVESDGLKAVTGPVDAVIANPPFLGGGIGRIYRNGGAQLGAALSIAWVREAINRLKPKGRILLYTGSAIIDGRDGLRQTLEQDLGRAGFGMTYDEVDPDIFGGTLWRPAYWKVDRIAAVTMVATKPG